MSKKNIQLNEEVVKSELKELARKSVEETLNELLDKEAAELTSAARIVGTFPDERSALMPVCARLRYVSGKE